MDYKYIEQLVERYFLCETTLEEEQILRAFFAQSEDSVPAELRQWQPLFAALAPKETLSDDFTHRILAMTEEAPRVKARTISLNERMRPLLRAAAVVAVILALGQAMHFSTYHANQQADDTGQHDKYPVSGHRSADIIKDHKSNHGQKECGCHGDIGL